MNRKINIFEHTIEIQDKNTFPFIDAEEAWFWFIASQNARNDGAQIHAGFALYPRPCEPSDIYRVVDRLYRKRRLVIDHLKVLRHYGLKGIPPEPQRVKEARAFEYWKEAMERIEEVLIRKRIVQKPQTTYQSQELGE